MIERIGLVVVTLLVSIGTAVPAQEPPPDAAGEPAWVMYRRGLHLLDERDLGTALREFRRALSARRPFPEAEAGIGRVFRGENNYSLAERQYERALEQADSFYVAETEYSVRYELADLYRLQSEWMRYQEELRAVAERNPQFSSDHDPPYRTLVPGVLTRAPLEDRPPEPRLDILLTLYRLEENFAYRAHRDLGEQYLANQRYDAAIPHLSFAVVAALSTLVEELRRDIYGYEFETTQGLISDALAVERLRAYIEDTELFRALFRLSGALYGFDGAGSPGGVPVEIWELLQAFPGAGGEWALRAERAMSRPRTALNVDY